MSAIFARCFRVLLAATVLSVPATPEARAAADLTAAVPAGVAPDNATPAAVYCTITGGYPNNVYAIKGTFSPGMRPYYGLTWAAQRQLWASQEERWDTCQPIVQTDKYGNWKGHIFVRLESTAPRGYLLFRISVVALKPIEDAGPTVSEWYGTTSVTFAPDGDGAWFRGHAYLDPGCTQPANGVVIQAINLIGGIAGAGLTQYSALPDGQNPLDVGYFNMAVASGWIMSVQARTRDYKEVKIYLKTDPPWIIPPGETASVDGAVWGDVNGDASLNAHDAVLALQIASGIDPYPLTFRQRADVCPDPPDNQVTLEDAVAIARRIYGK